ncbi:MAG: hypothetical protein HXY42_02540 [Chloroflexi bacterium]|nr:hypothetical protein [Chloroflexota bacterium]
MFIFITVGLLLLTALFLLTLRFMLPDFRFAWLTATGGAFLAWISVFFWQTGMPASVALPLWQPESVFRQSPLFLADGIAWAFALSVTTICLAVIITSVARDNFPSPLSWIGVLTLTGLGVLAVTADNPLTLVLLWAAIDLTEMTSQMRFVENPRLSERVVISFASRVTGILILLWANMVSASEGFVLDFSSPPPRAGIYLIIASALRLGVLPIHLPYASESSFRRGFGTALRMISSGSSLILLARIPPDSVSSSITPVLTLLVAAAALYGAWMWLRAPDELAGRPYWLIGLGSLAVASALRGNPIGATAWSCALILCGGVLFLASAKSRWLETGLLVGLWGISALPFSLTASGWVNPSGTHGYIVPFLVAAQAMLLAGYHRQSQRSAARTSFENQPIWAKNVYPLGVYVILLTILLLGFFGWEGTLQIGNWALGVTAAFLMVGVLWLIPRVRLLNPVRAHWVRTTDSTQPDIIYRTIWTAYRAVRRLLNAFSNVLEGESGIMWTLLFLVLFISIFSQAAP